MWAVAAEALRFAAILAAFLGLGMVAWAGQGYLVAGPVALRFSPPAKPAQPLPYSALAPVAKPETTNTTPAAVEHHAAVTNAAPTVMAHQPEPVPVVVQTNLVVGVQADPDTVSPQMLLKYFNKSTNGASSTILTPFNFAPPTQPPASKATYSKAP